MMTDRQDAVTTPSLPEIAQLMPAEETRAIDPPAPPPHPIHVFTERNWKEYLGESLLIVFSVLLALFVTEYVNKQREHETTRRILESVAGELKHNRAAIVEMQNYNLQVLERIDTALVSRTVQQQLVSNDEFHLTVIAPQGVLYRYLDNASWSVARNSNIISKIDVESAALLTKVYEDQDRIGKVENEVAVVILGRESRDPAKVHATLVLIRDIYHGWAVDRVPELLKRIDAATDRVERLGRTD
jgi:hypothetical protein